ncbi:sugar transferase [Microbacterium sp.]|uniref:sugar transferase n=1 Tax=Microbacterium sp. TaxID=51671 RepID=UPI003F6E964B
MSEVAFWTFMELQFANIHETLAGDDGQEGGALDIDPTSATTSTSRLDEPRSIFPNVIGWIAADANRQAIGLKDTADFTRARRMLSPRSPLGPLLGLTDKDLDRALTRVHERHALSHAQATLKRALDVVAAVAAMVFLSPVMLVVAILIKLDSPGPICFYQERIGIGGRVFRLLKFRTMHLDAEHLLARAVAAVADGEGSNGVLFKMMDDPRITRVGRFLRRYSIDEWPQFLNVIAGHMSIVGPRPSLPSEQLYRQSDLRTLPGITGLWAIADHRDLSWEEAVRIDDAYGANWTLRGDLRIMLRTLMRSLRPVRY